MSDKLVPFDLLESLKTADVWARSPLNRKQIDKILTAPQLAQVVPSARTEALRLTFAKALDFAVPHVVLWPKEGSRARFSKYVHAVIKLQTEWNSVNRFRNAPPKPSPEWMEATVAWMKKNLTGAPQNGRAPEIGHDDFFCPLLVVYEIAFGRPPSATPNGPTYRFMRAIWSELAVAITDPPWPAMSDAAMLARIKRNRVGDEADRSLMQCLMEAFSEGLIEEQPFVQ